MNFFVYLCGKIDRKTKKQDMKRYFFLMALMFSLATQAQEAPESLHMQLKEKFIDGSPLFMSLVALALVLGLAFCIERIVYLTLSEINAKKLLQDVDARVEAGDIEGAKQLCRNTRGPVASICYQGLLHIRESMDDIERSIMSYGSVQTAKLEKGCSWIKLFIAMAPSLGFLGTVIGMAFIMFVALLFTAHLGRDRYRHLQLYHVED